MHKYPTTIEEAAALLTTVKPNWYDQIDLNRLDMTKDEDCILGQLYGVFSKGKEALFKKEWGVSQDSIFGRKADVGTWKKIIHDLRPSHDILWAVAELKKGNRVRLHDYVARPNHVLLTYDMIQSTNWTSVEVKMLSDIVPGTWFEHEGVKYKKLNSLELTCYVISENEAVKELNLSRVVYVC